MKAYLIFNLIIMVIAVPLILSLCIIGELPGLIFLGVIFLGMYYEA